MSGTLSNALTHYFELGLDPVLGVGQMLFTVRDFHVSTLASTTLGGKRSRFDVGVLHVQTKAPGRVSQRSGSIAQCADGHSETLVCQNEPRQW